MANESQEPVLALAAQVSTQRSRSSENGKSFQLCEDRLLQLRVEGQSDTPLGHGDAKPRVEPTLAIVDYPTEAPSHRRRHGNQTICLRRHWKVLAGLS